MRFIAKRTPPPSAGLARQLYEQRRAQKFANNLSQQELDLQKQALEYERMNSNANRQAQWWAQANAANTQKELQQQDYVNQSDFARGQQERAYLEARRGRRSDESRRRRMLREGREDQTTAFDRSREMTGYQAELERLRQREYQDLYRRNLMDTEAQKAQNFMTRDILQSDLGLQEGEARFDQDMQRLVKQAELGDESASMQLRERFGYDQRGADAAQVRGREDLDYRTQIEEQIREGERKFGKLKESRQRIDEMVDQGWRFTPEDESYIRQIQANIRRSRQNPNLNAEQKTEAIGHWEEVLDSMYPTIRPQDQEVDIKSLLDQYTMSDPITGALIGVDPATNQFYRIADKPREYGYGGSRGEQETPEQKAEQAALEAFQKEWDEYQKNPYVVGPNEKLVKKLEPSLEQTRVRRGLPSRAESIRQGDPRFQGPPTPGGPSAGQQGQPSGPQSLEEAETMLEQRDPDVMAKLREGLESGELTEQQYVQLVAEISSHDPEVALRQASFPDQPQTPEQVKQEESRMYAQREQEKQRLIDIEVKEIRDDLGGIDNDPAIRRARVRNPREAGKAITELKKLMNENIKHLERSGRPIHFSKLNRIEELLDSLIDGALQERIVPARSSLGSL